MDTKLRVQLLAIAVKNDAVAVRQRAAELLGERPSLMDQSFKEGMAIRVRWKVVDKTGRRGEGEREIPLEVKEH